MLVFVLFFFYVSSNWNLHFCTGCYFVLLILKHMSLKHVLVHVCFRLFFSAQFYLHLLTEMSDTVRKRPHCDFCTSTWAGTLSAASHIKGSDWALSWKSLWEAAEADFWLWLYLRVSWFQVLKWLDWILSVRISLRSCSVARRWMSELPKASRHSHWMRSFKIYLHFKRSEETSSMCWGECAQHAAICCCELGTAYRIC